jgi:hypothetical protein
VNNWKFRAGAGGLFVAGILAGVALSHAGVAPTSAPVATLTVGATAASIALLAVLTTWRTITASRHNARATVTFQHIAKIQTKDFTDARLLVRKAINDGGIAKYANLEHADDQVTLSINLVLNDLEMVSIGIQRGIIDCEFFRAWAQEGTVSLWRDLKPYVAALRRRLDRNSIFHQVEAMADAWDTTRANYKPDTSSPFLSGKKPTVWRF